MQLPPGFLPHSVTIEPLTGSGGMGSTFGDPVTVAAMVEDGARLVRAADGAEAVSSARVHCEFAVHAPVGSFVTIWAGTARERTAKVIAIGGADHPAVPGHQTLALS